VILLSKKLRMERIMIVCLQATDFELLVSVL